MKQQKLIGKEVGCKFNRIHPEKQELNIFRAINEIFKHIKQSTKLLK